MNRAKQKTKEEIRAELSEAVMKEISYLGADYADELSMHLSGTHGLIDVMHSSLIAFPPDEEGERPKRTIDLTVTEFADFVGLLKREMLIAGHLLNAVMEEWHREKKEFEKASMVGLDSLLASQRKA